MRIPPRLAFALLVVWGVHRAGLGELDFTVINLKAAFVPRALGARSGYADSALVTSTPGVRLRSVPRTPVRATAPRLVTMSQS